MTSAEPLVTIHQLKKEFGSIVAVDDVSFSVPKGEVLGFLGPNGAGKSTTMKMITGFLTPTSGSVTVCGFDVQNQPLEAKSRLGYLPEGAPAYQDMTPKRFLDFIAELRGYRGEERTKRVADTVEKVNLGGVLHQSIETLSKGFKRRVGLAQAILHDPDVLVLDEPTDGLDPNQKHEVRTLIKHMAHEKAIILSTHILEEVHAVCSRAIIITKGKVVIDGTPRQLEEKSRLHNTVTVAVEAFRAHLVFKTLQELPGVKAVEELESDAGTIRYRVYPDRQQSLLHTISSTAQEQHWDLTELQNDRGQLEDVFRTVTEPSQPLS